MDAIREGGSLLKAPSGSAQDSASVPRGATVVSADVTPLASTPRQATPDKTSNNAAMQMENDCSLATDEQTGKVFKLQPESALGVAMAVLSGAYLLGCLLFFLWLLLDTWSGKNVLLVHMGYDANVLRSKTFRLMAYVAIAGALGGAADGIRGLIVWHAERQAFGPRFIWKNLSLPLIGATVAVFVYVALRGGVGLLNGDFSLSSQGGTPVAAAFAIAAVAGFSSWQVFRWLDAQANRIFSLAKTDLPGAQNSSSASLPAPTVRDAIVAPTSHVASALRADPESRGPP